MRQLIPLLVIVSILSGCASNRTDLVKTGYLSLQPTLTASLAHPPEVYEQEGELVVKGQMDSSEVRKGGHVDIQVVGPDGAVVYDASVNYRMPQAPMPVGPRGQYRGPRSSSENHATYAVRFPGLPPAGSVVSVKYDPQPHGASGSK